MQRQIDRLLQEHRQYAKIYVNDIVIFSKNLDEHLKHLRQIFDMLIVNNIFIKFEKTFVEYSTIHLLDQKVNSLDLTIVENKLRTIVNLRYLRSLQLLKIYLELTKWLCDYVSMYASIAKSLQKLKTTLLRDNLVVESVKRKFFASTRLQEFIEQERVSFNTL